jgi:acetolactate synthase I/II/III large subunit
LNGAALIVQTLEESGITHAFGIAGHGNLPILDALVESRISFYSTAHEQVAVHAADAFFRVSNRPAVVLTSVGPGLTNTLTAMGDALMDSSAVIVVAGDVPTDFVGRGALQEVTVLGDNDNATPFRSFCKRVVKPAHPTRLGDALAETYAYATSACPGPVLLDVPLNFQVTEAGHALPNLSQRASGQQAVRPDATLVDAAAAALMEAKRPVIYAGGGVRSDRALATLRVLVDLYRIPVATTMSGQGSLPGSHALCLGTTGVVGCRPANQALPAADLVLALGTRFPDMDTNSWSPERFASFPPARLIQVDISAEEIGRVFPASPGLVADAGAFLTDFLTALSDRRADAALWRDWSDAQISSIKQWRKELITAEASDQPPFTPQFVVRTVRETIPEHAVLVTGVGIRHTVAQHFSCSSPRRLIVGSGFGTMGQEPAALIGAKLAAPDAPVVGLVGDGAMLASLAALPTAAQYSIPALWVLLNNGGYASINVYQMKHYERSIGTLFETPAGGRYAPDYVGVARGFGIEADRLTTAEQLRQGLRRALNLERPLLLEIPVTARPSLNSSGYWPINDLYVADAASRAREGTVGRKG